jgi:hypothetical protein
MVAEVVDAPGATCGIGEYPSTTSYAAIATIADDSSPEFRLVFLCNLCVLYAFALGGNLLNNEDSVAADGDGNWHEARTFARTVEADTVRDAIHRAVVRTHQHVVIQ